MWNWQVAALSCGLLYIYMMDHLYPEIDVLLKILQKSLHYLVGAKYLDHLKNEIIIVNIKI